MEKCSWREEGVPWSVWKTEVEMLGPEGRRWAVKRGRGDTGMRRGWGLAEMEDGTNSDLLGQSW